MNTEKKSFKKLFVMCLTVIALGMCAVVCRAQEGLLDLNQKAVRGSAIVQTWGLAAEKSSCRMASILGLCGSREGMQTKAVRTGGWILGRSLLRGLNMQVARINAKKEAAMPKIFQIAKMFIDDVEIAEVGDFKVKFSISLE
ncbi:MAG: hypothetical protein HY924_10155 [Elusimicrobia bacterium]|nr:hypothetical protein [Elusimicrobiota bacterium]